MHRFVQHSGQLYISTLAVAELYTWAYQRSDPQSLADRIERELLADVRVLDFDSECARKFGEVRGTLLVRGIVVSRIDLMIGCVALVHDLTLVTHNTADYRNIPDLRLVDWLAP
jgi:tRNA(fMet)-specific endonuclease VapC